MIERTKNGRTLINGIELQYISGSLIPLFRLKHKDQNIQKENFDDFVNLFKYMQNHLKGYFTLGTLYNAYQEKEDGKFLFEHDKIGHQIILSDSGGLQQARKGVKFSDQTKKEIYINQAKYSDLAMSFDEMPFAPIEANRQNGINLSATRCYVRELIDKAAFDSAEEVKKQIEVFDEIGTDTKILPVIHGFRPNPEYFRGFGDNTYLDYAKKLINYINSTSKNFAGLSFGSMTVSPDNRIGILKLLQYIPDTLWSPDLPAKNLEHIHLLGLAAPQRLLVVLTLIKAGLIDSRVKKISFDSTALTRAYFVGRVHKNRNEFEQKTPMKPVLTLKDYKDPTAENVRHYYQQVHQYFKDYSNYMFDSWEDLADHSQNNGAKMKIQEQIEANGGIGSIWHRKFLQQIRICSLYTTWCYLEAMEDYIDGKRSVFDFSYNSDILAIYHSIEHDIKDRETLFEVVEMYYKKVKSNMDLGVDTMEQYYQELNKRTIYIEKGTQETNILFDNLEKLHHVHQNQKIFQEQNYEKYKSRINRKNKINNEYNLAKKITDNLF